MEYKLADDTWNNDELNAIKRVIESNRFTMGQEVENFEQEWAKKVGSKYAIMSNSGSSANLLAIAALYYSGRLTDGDEVLVPAVSWSTTYFPLAQHNLCLKFIDIDKNSLNMDCKQIESAITNKTKAICIVNLLGNSNDFDFISATCIKYNLILIEDNCESLGGTYKGKQLGTFGVLGTYSTFYSHHLCTMEGGITVTNDEELYHYMLCIRAHGWTRNLPTNSSIYTKNLDSFYESYNFIMPGYNLRPLEIEAAIGIEQIKKLDKIIETRRQNAQYFLDSIKSIDNVRVQSEIGNSSWFGFALVLENNNVGKRKLIIEALMRHQVEVRPIVAGNFTRNPAIRYINHTIHNELKNADDIHENGFFVGNHSQSNKDQIDLFISVLKEVLV